MNVTHRSEIAQLREQIRTEYEAYRSGLSGLSSGSTRHQFITTKAQNIADFALEVQEKHGVDAAMEAMIALENEEDEKMQKHEWKQDQLKNLSAEQLTLYIHETEWIISQVNVPSDKEKPVPEVYKHVSDFIERVIDMQEALILERASRQFAFLQAEVAVCLEQERELDSLLYGTSHQEQEQPITE